jgi:hypothetical protein
MQANDKNSAMAVSCRFHLTGRVSPDATSRSDRRRPRAVPPSLWSTKGVARLPSLGSGSANPAGRGRVARQAWKYQAESILFTFEWIVSLSRLTAALNCNSLTDARYVVNPTLRRRCHLL